MSRNNLILVIAHRGRYYVVPNVNADEEWSHDFARLYVSHHGRRYTRDRGRALVRAHNLQLRMQTEYGVRELQC